MADLEYASDGHESHALADVIATAAITAALVPFIQQLAQKAAEETYDGARSWLRELFQRSDAKRVPAGHRNSKLLIVRDPDPALNLSLVASTELSDRAIKALEQLDLDDAVTKANRGKPAKVQVFWDERAGLWRIEG